MKFEWPRFLHQYNIRYVTSGPNVARDHWAIKCPFCGENDPSEHMGLNLVTGSWGCWRNPQHRGNKPYKLVRQVLQCGHQEALDIVGDGAADLSEFDTFVQTLHKKKKTKIVVNKSPKNTNLSFLNTIKLIDGTKYLSSRFLQYLSERGFGLDSPAVADFYRLRYCLVGDWANRLIVPIYSRGKLVTWTGRSIFDSASLRYKTLSVADGAVENIKSLIFEPKSIGKGGKVLFITEGPFDAIKVDYYAKQYDCRATCVFGTGYTEDQKWCLSKLAKRFTKTVILFDEGAGIVASRLQQDLIPTETDILQIPNGKSDPGELDEYEIKELCNSVV